MMCPMKPPEERNTVRQIMSDPETEIARQDNGDALINDDHPNWRDEPGTDSDDAHEHIVDFNAAPKREQQAKQGGPKHDRHGTVEIIDAGRRMPVGFRRKHEL